MIVGAFFGGDHDEASFMGETMGGRKRPQEVAGSEQNSNVYLFPSARQLPERLTKDIVARLWTSLVHLSQAKKIILQIVLGEGQPAETTSPRSLAAKKEATGDDPRVASQGNWRWGGGRAALVPSPRVLGRFMQSAFIFSGD
ncbi:MAG TPA: hypothetical protein VKH44_07520 [Pirellulaceae bacterium]|nr:hypothetical protein [Pirellulaceae bacterium]